MATFKLKLNLKERMESIALIPTEGNRIDLKLFKSIEDILDWSLEEIEKYKLTFTGTANGGVHVSWDKRTDLPEVFELTFNSTQIDLLKRRIAELDSQKKIPYLLLDFCEKVETATPEPEVVKA